MLVDVAKWTASERGVEATSTCETTFDCYSLTVPDVPGLMILCCIDLAINLDYFYWPK